jgi:protein SCO1/2/putative membrane protein
MARFLAVALAAAVLAAAGAAQPFPPQSDSLYQDFVDPVPPFALTDQTGHIVRRDDLVGKVWVANFFFTGCAGDCSKTNASMARLQGDLAGYPEVQLVGFSVYPEQDTPEVLRKYAEGWGADPQRWHLLTGKTEVVYDLIRNGFKQGLERSKVHKPGFEVDHSVRLLVIDQHGKIRGYVDGTKPEQVERLEERITELVRAQRRADAAFLPALNAVLNGSCALLLAVGFVAIRRRWVRTHKALMLSALAVSAGFLACYLYYHFAVLEGQPTRFSGEGLVRPFYFALLLSHTVLAAVVAPLAVLVTLLGLSGRLARHVGVARLTLPLWMYVSLTGVLVYWMLYHLYPPL